MDPEIANNGMGVAHLLSQNTGVGLLPFILLVIPYIVNIFGFLFSRFVLENFIKDPIID